MNEDFWITRTTGPGVPLVERGKTGWLRARLGRDLHERFYGLYGLQALPVSFSSGVGTLVLASPHCRRAPRVFGRLGDGEASTKTSYPPSLPSFSNVDEQVSFEHPWDSWDELRQSVISTLGLADANVAGHQSCFHRSSRSLYPIAFEVAVNLMADDWGRWRTDRHLEWGGAHGHGQSFLAMAGIPEEHFDRYLTVYSGPDWAGVAIGNDGVAKGLERAHVDLGADWRGGAPARLLAASAASISGLAGAAEP